MVSGNEVFLTCVIVRHRWCGLGSRSQGSPICGRDVGPHHGGHVPDERLHLAAMSVETLLEPAIPLPSALTRPIEGVGREGLLAREHPSQSGWDRRLGLGRRVDPHGPLPPAAVVAVLLVVEAVPAVAADAAVGADAERVSVAVHE